MCLLLDAEKREGGGYLYISRREMGGGACFSAIFYAFPKGLYVSSVYQFQEFGDVGAHNGELVRHSLKRTLHLRTQIIQGVY